MGIADSASSLDHRTVATTALQSLILLNSKFASQQAAFFADRVRREISEDTGAQVARAFELALCRKPTAGELADSLAFLSAQARFVSGQKGHRQDKVGHRTFKIDYTKTIEIEGQATVTFFGDGQNGHLISNYDKLVVEDVSPDIKQPFHGQFVQVDVVKVEEAK